MLELIFSDGNCEQLYLSTTTSELRVLQAPLCSTIQCLVDIMIKDCEWHMLVTYISLDLYCVLIMMKNDYVCTSLSAYLRISVYCNYVGNYLCYEASIAG